MSYQDIIDHFCIRGACLIVHAPSTIDEFKLLVGYQCLDLVSFSLALFFPPHGEVFHFRLSELPLGVIQQGVDDSGYYEIHSSKSTSGVLVLEFVKVAINGLQPSHVVVGMRNYVNRDGLRLTVGLKPLDK